MVRDLRALLLFFLFVTSSATWAADAKKNAEMLKSEPNGCGAGWTVYLVPDSIPLFDCSFKEACDAHDNCYGKCTGREKDRAAPECEYLRCKPDGDLYRSRECRTTIKFARLAIEAERRRSQCDVSIGDDILAGNPGRAVCRAFAYAYAKAVKSFGESHFQGLDAVTGSVTQSKEDYEAAIRDFFRKGTEAEFQAFNDSPPSFKKNLKYVPGRGLINVGHGE